VTPVVRKGGDIYQAFERHLAGWRRRYAGRPDREMLRLCLLSLEREENVAVAYDERVMRRRLATMPLPDDVRELIRHALLWVWRDEEMHALYMRGALLALGRPLLTARTLLQQQIGRVGGWTVAVRQHVGWSQAPLARGAATLLTWAGGLSGRVPREVRHHLVYSSFRAFCRYNMDAERTAWLCWKRLAELAPQVPALAARPEEFHRVAHDEDRHRRVFTILAEVLTGDGRLHEGETTKSLASRLGAVGESFLPHSQRCGRSAPRVGLRTPPAARVRGELHGGQIGRDVDRSI